MSKTPRTDKLLDTLSSSTLARAYMKLLDFTRKLELEIAILEKDIDDLHKSNY